MRHSSRRTHRMTGFTLIELLVCVAIITLLMAILLPSLFQARERAKAAVCQSNMRTFAAASIVAAGENNGILPGAYGDPVTEVVSGVTISWSTTWQGGVYMPTGTYDKNTRWDVSKGTLYPYFRSAHALICPSTPPDMLPYVYMTNPKYPCQATPYSMNENASSVKIGTIQNASDVSLYDESAQVTYSGSTVLKFLSHVEYPSTSQCLNGAPNFVGRHNKRGAVAWADGHGSIETPYIPNPSDLTTLPLPVAQFVVKTAQLGFLTPCPQSESYSDLIKDARVNQWCVQDGTSWVSGSN